MVWIWIADCTWSIHTNSRAAPALGGGDVLDLALLIWPLFINDRPSQTLSTGICDVRGGSCHGKDNADVVLIAGPDNHDSG